MRIPTLLAALLLSAPLLAEEAQEAEDGKTDPYAEWSVTEPPGDWETITIDTEEVTWSDVDVHPGGETLVFHMLGDIYTVPIDGGEATALTADLAWNFQPRYSPDGSKIAFVSDRDGAENIWIMDADGSNLTQVSDESDHLLHNPAWSPDGDYIAARKGYVSQRSIPAGSIWMYHRGGGKGVMLVDRLHGEQSQKNIAEPEFSPDGRYVYFSQDVTSGRVWEYNKDANQGVFAIRRLDRETGETETVVSGPGATSTSARMSLPAASGNTTRTPIRASSPSGASTARPARPRPWSRVRAAPSARCSRPTATAWPSCAAIPPS